MSSLLSDQPLVRRVLGADELNQRVPEQVWVTAVVVPERHLVEVCGKVTGALITFAYSRPLVYRAESRCLRLANRVA